MCISFVSARNFQQCMSPSLAHNGWRLGAAAASTKRFAGYCLSSSYYIFSGSGRQEEFHPKPPHRTVRESLPSYGSSYLYLFQFKEIGNNAMMPMVEKLRSGLINPCKPLPTLFETAIETPVFTHRPTDNALI